MKKQQNCTMCKMDKKTTKANGYILKDLCVKCEKDMVEDNLFMASFIDENPDIEQQFDEWLEHDDVCNECREGCCSECGKELTKEDITAFEKYKASK